MLLVLCSCLILETGPHALLLRGPSSRPRAARISSSTGYRGAHQQRQRQSAPPRAVGILQRSGGGAPGKQAATLRQLLEHSEEACGAPPSKHRGCWRARRPHTARECDGEITATTRPPRCTMWCTLGDRQGDACVRRTVELSLTPTRAEQARRRPSWPRQAVWPRFGRMAIARVREVGGAHPRQTTNRGVR